MFNAMMNLAMLIVQLNMRMTFAALLLSLLKHISRELYPMLAPSGLGNPL